MNSCWGPHVGDLDGWSMGISAKIRMDQWPSALCQGKFKWTNHQQYPPRMALVHGWLFPDCGQNSYDIASWKPPLQSASAIFAIRPICSQLVNTPRRNHYSSGTSGGSFHGGASFEGREGSFCCIKKGPGEPQK